MSTILMSVDLDMYLGTSPVLSSSPLFTNDFLSDLRYTAIWTGTPSETHHTTDRLHRAFSYDETIQNGRMKSMAPLPLRSCLIVRSSSSCQFSEPSSPKKKVVFADDKGFSLAQIRVMKEPSHCPPRWSCEFLGQITGGAIAEVSMPKWTLGFSQPAANYLDFRDRLEHNLVAVENVIIKEAESIITGTVKVKNVSFQKEVFIRITFDEWKSHKDVFAAYNPSLSSGCNGATSHDLYDTFTFNIAIPQILQPTSAVMCACFRSEGCEFWDNNGGSNYKITKVCGDKKSENAKGRCDDAINVTMNTWSEFASWNQLSNDTPYW